VIDIFGNCVALNAGGSKFSSQSFFFPLNRIQRALNCLKKNIPITRGTFQVEFEAIAFENAVDAGMTRIFEDNIQHFLRNYYLRVKAVVPFGPAD
jgi:S1-C subfamily serine protease